MTPKERLRATLQGRPVDRIASAPLILNHCSRVTGVTVRQFNHDADLMGKAQVRAWERYGHDMPLIFTTTATVAEAMGTRLFFPDDDAPRVETPFVGDAADVDRVLVADPWRDGRLPVYLAAASHVVETLGDRVFVGCIFAAPFTTASHLRGTETFIRETYRNPGLVNELLAKAKASAFNMIDALAQLAVVPVIVEPVASASLISPRQFEQYVLPHLVDIVDRAHAKGLPICLHICGKTRPVVKLMAESRADILSLDQIDMGEARELVGEKTCLLGNVKPAETLLKGTPEAVRDEVREIIAKAAGSPRGLIVSSGCEMPLNTPPANIDALIEAARIYGRR
jgi:uroporphyrinogen decarboxylase